MKLILTFLDLSTNETLSTNALPLALQAIEECINRHGAIDLQDITHVNTISCTGMYAPGLDIENSSTPKANIIHSENGH